MINAELSSAAEDFHNLRIPVIPFRVWKENGIYEKKNIGYWKKWETEPQTDEEFKALDWTEANALAVILGTKATNGKYLSVIDHDVKPKPKETEQEKEARLKGIAIGKEILKDFPTTQIDESGNKGLHLVYWSRTKPNTDGTFHDTAALDF